MSNPPRFRMFLACCCALLFAGCGDDGDVSSSSGSSGDAPAKAKDVDACALLDKAEVAEVIGEPVSKVDGAEASEGVGTCSWYGADDGSLLQKGVTLIAAADNGKERWGGHKELLTDEPKPVSGIGDDAFTDGEIIAAYDGDAFVVISPLYNDAGVSVEQVKPLGITALDALK